MQWRWNLMVVGYCAVMESRPVTYILGTVGEVASGKASTWWGWHAGIGGQWE